MSIIHHDWLQLFRVALFAIYAVLFDAENGEPKDRLEARGNPHHLSPPAAPTKTRRALNNPFQQHAAGGAKRLGLVEEVDNKLRLTVEARGGEKRGQSSEVYFRAYLSRTLFDSTRALETGQSGFMVALAWFLSANPLTPMGFAEPAPNWSQVGNRRPGQQDRTNLPQSIS